MLSGTRAHRRARTAVRSWRAASPGRPRTAAGARCGSAGACDRRSAVRRQRASSQSSTCGCVSARRIEVDLQRADARREVEQPRELPGAAIPRAAPAPGSAARDRAPARRTRPAGCSRPARRTRSSRVRSRRRAARAAIGRDCLRACRRLAATRLEAHLVAGPELAELPQLVVDDGHRAHEAAEARPIGPEDHRHVAGEVDAADGVRVVVDVRGMQPGFAAIAARPAAASGRSAARRCGWSCSALPIRRRRTRAMSSGVKKSGAPCGPSVTRDVPALARSSAARRRAMA